MQRALLLLAVTMLASCVSPAKTYKAPDDTKVRTATHDLNIKVKTARETAAKAKKAAEDAKAIHERMVASAGTVKELLDKLAVQLPEYAGPFREISGELEKLLSDNAELTDKLNQLTGWNTQLEAQLKEAESARLTLQGAQDDYTVVTSSLARDATNERNEKIEVQKKLLWYRVRFWGAWASLIGAVVAWVIFGLLKVGVRWGTR